jgi:hypothetical protein
MKKNAFDMIHLLRQHLKAIKIKILKEIFKLFICQNNFFTLNKAINLSGSGE